MRKRILLKGLLLLFVTAFPFTAKVEAQNCPDGTLSIDTVVSWGADGNYIVPFGATTQSYYAIFTSWTVYSRNELANVGLLPGSVIREIGFRLQSGPDCVMENLSIYMKEVPQTATNVLSDSVTLSDMTLVYNSQQVSFASGWNWLTLDSLFTLTGQGNLMVAIHREPSQFSGMSYFNCASGKTVVRYKSQNGTTYINSVRTQRASISFRACVDTTPCTPPDSMICHSSGTTVTVILPSQPAERQVVIGESGFNPDTISSSYPGQWQGLGDTVVFSSLDAGVLYDVYVRSVCGATTYSLWSQPAQVRTHCGVQTTPYSNNCNTAAVVDSCLVLHNAHFVSTSGNGIYRIDDSKSATVVLPEFDTPVSTLRVAFWRSFYNSAVEVGVMTNPYDTTSFIPYDTLTQGTYVETDFHRYSESEGRIAIRWNTGGRIRNIVVDTVHECFAPYDITVDYDSGTTATVHWRNRAAYVTEYNVVCRPVGSQDWTAQSTNQTHLTIDSLEYGTLYEVLVAAICNDNDHSSWPTTRFTTGCVPITTLPYQLEADQVLSYEGFPYIQPPCWTYLLDSTTYTAYWILPETDTTNIRMDHLKMTYNIRYQYNYSGIHNNSTRTELEIGVMDNVWDTNTFVPFDTARLVSNVCNYFSGDMVAYSPLRQGKHLAFRSPQGLIMDVNQVKIEESVCHPVSDIVMTDRNANSITLNWRENGAASQWIVDYHSANGSQQGSHIANSKPFTITGLQQHTNYNVSIRALNGADTSIAASAQFSTSLDSNLTTTMIQIGTPYTDNDYELPIRRSDKHSWSQTLYPLSQYAVTGFIDTVWFYCLALCPGGGTLDTSLTLYMGHWPRDYAQDQYDWVPMDSLHQVFHTSEWRATSANSWIPIVLDTPFYYNGVDELAVVFSHSNSTTRGAGDYFTYDWMSTPLGVNLSVGGDADSLAQHPCVGVPTYRTIGRAHARFSLLTSSCLSVSDLQVVSVSRDTVHLTWQERGSASQWQVACTDEDSNLTTHIVNSLPQCTISGLASNHTYTFQVRPICGDGDTGFYYGNATATIVTCPVVDSISVSDILETSALVSWNASEFATQWEVYFSEIPSDPNSSVIHSGVVSTSNNQVILSGLHNRTTYAVTVRAICGAGDSSLLSEIVTFTTLRGYYDYDTVQIGSIGSTYNYWTPFDAYYKHSWVEMLYPAEEIGFDGYIDTIWWNAASVGTSVPDTSVTIYMGHTSMAVHATTSSWVPDSMLQQVFHATQVQPLDTGWFAIPLDEPFHYNGVDNLAICVSFHCDPWTTAWKYHYNTHEWSILSRYNDNDTSYANHPGTATGTRSYDLPVTRFSMSGESSNCQRPYNLEAEAETFDSAVVSWQGSESDSLYLVTVVSELNDTIMYITSGNILPISNLQPETQYTVSVSSLCEEGLWSNAVSAQFTTFERCPMPTNFSVVNAVNAVGVELQWDNEQPSGEWQLSYGAGITDPTQGTHLSADSTDIILPPLSIGGSYNAYVRMVCGIGDTSHWTGPLSFNVGIVTLNQNHCDTIVTCGSHLVDDNMSFYLFGSDTLVIFPASEGSFIAVSGTVDLQEYNNGPLHLKIYDGAGTDGTLWGTFNGVTTIPQLISTQGPLTVVFTCLDYYDGGFQLDITCVPDDGCPTSPLAVAHHVLDTTARMHWTYNSPMPQTFTVAYAPFDSFDTSDATTLNLVTGITDTLLQLTGLQPGTLYLAAVRAECGEGQHSRWTISNDFHTTCMAVRRIDLPYTEDFSSWGTSSLESVTEVIDPCWRYNTNGTSTFVYHNSTLNPSVPHYINMSHYGWTHSALVLPLFEDSVADLKITFMAQNGYPGLYNQYVEVVEVGVMDNPMDYSTYVPLWRDTLVGDSWQHYTVPLGPQLATLSAQPSGRYIAIVAPEMTDYHSGYDLNVANIRVSLDLPCMPPLSLDVDSVAYSEAYLSITDTTTPDYHILAYGTSPELGMTTDTVMFTGFVATLQNLDADMQYFAWVRNLLLDGDDSYFSPWTGPISFRTLMHEEPVTFTAHAFSNNPAIGSADVNCEDAGQGSTCTGVFEEGTLLTFTATPIGETSRFLYWNDGDTSNPRYVTLVQDTVLTAYFETVEAIEMANSRDVVLKPNPASDRVSITSDKPILVVEVYNVSGVRMATLKPDDCTCEIDVSQWSSGTYIVKATTRGHTVVRRLVVN